MASDASRTPADSLYPVSLYDYDFAKIAAARGKAGDMAGALETLALVKDPSKISDWVWADIAEGQLKAGNFDGALRMVDKAKDEKGREAVLWTIVIAQTKIGDLAGAIQAVQRMKIGPSQGNALLVIAWAQIDQGDRERARQTIREAQRQGGGGDWATFPSLYAANGDIADALALAADYRSQGEVRGYNLSLRGIAVRQAKSGDVDGAMRTAYQMTDEKWKAETLMDIAVAQAKQGNQIGATRTFEEARRIAQSVQRDLYDLRGSTPAEAQAGTLSRLAIAQAEAGDASAALETARNIRIEKIRLEAFIKSAKAQAENGDRMGATRTMAQALELASRTPENSTDFLYTREIALSNVLQAQAEIGDYSGALLILSDRVLASYGRGDNLKAITKAQAKAGDLDGAIRLADLEKDPEAKIQGLLGIAEGLSTK